MYPYPTKPAVAKSVPVESSDALLRRLMYIGASEGQRNHERLGRATDGQLDDIAEEYGLRRRTQKELDAASTVLWVRVKV